MIMKKKYLIPQTAVTKVELQQMIAASLEGKLNTNDGASVSSLEEVGSRRSSGWDDDDY